MENSLIGVLEGLWSCEEGEASMKTKSSCYQTFRVRKVLRERETKTSRESCKGSNVFGGWPGLPENAK